MLARFSFWAYNMLEQLMRSQLLFHNKYYEKSIKKGYLMKRRVLRKPVSVSIAILMTMSILMTGCAGDFAETVERAMNGDYAGKKWVNSETEGGIDADTPTNIKDDFFTAVNKDWILEQTLDESGMSIQLLNSQKLMDRRLIDLCYNLGNADISYNENVGMTGEEIRHAEELVSLFFDAISDEELRNSQGVEPLREYLDKIRAIKTLDEMKDYILDFNGANLIGAPIVEISVSPTLQDPVNNYVVVEPVSSSNLGLGDPVEYVSMDGEGLTCKNVYSGIIRYVMTKMGYSMDEIRSVLARSYRFEGRIAEDKNSNGYINTEIEIEHTADVNLQELTDMFGEYPIEDILNYYGYDGASMYRVLEKECVAHVKKAFSEKNLEEIKAYYITHTIMTYYDFLDTETAEAVKKIINLGQDVTEENPDDQVEAGMSPEDQKKLKLINDYGMTYLAAPLNMLYIASYCEEEQKQQILDMVSVIKDEMTNVFRNSDWLSDESKEKCIEKLQFMEQHALYPDKYISYDSLDFEGDNLLEMLRDIRIHEKQRYAYRVDTPVDRKEWDLSFVPTVTVNAYNCIQQNAIYVLAGIVSDDFVFNVDNNFETNLARLGTLVGHEITHGFDDTGASFDKYGMETSKYGDNILTADDGLTFSKKQLRLTNWYMILVPIKGKSVYGAPVSGEAIADMGGMKCAILVGENIPDFDFDLFFRSYAEMWRKVNTLEVETNYAQYDSHPLAMYRVNVVLAQFDRFYETYGIGQDDGMYIDDKEKVLVW